MAKSFASSKRQVFLSYRRSPANVSVARELRTALEAEGLVVWLDERDIDAFEDIPDAIRDGLRSSHALVAFYDEAYAKRRACQWELTEALIATASSAAKRKNRVFVVTPTQALDHVRPRMLRRALTLTLNEETPVDIARAVRREAERLRSTIGKARRPRAKPWVGVGEFATYARFVGRTTEMWDIFDALSEDVVILHGCAAARAARICTHGAGLANRCWRRNTPDDSLRSIPAACSGSTPASVAKTGAPRSQAHCVKSLPD